MLGHIMVDLDGTLVDFMLGVRRAIGRSWESFKTPAEKAERAHLLFERGDAFWENLPPMPDFHQLWGFIQPYHPEVLTAVPHGNVNGALSHDATKFAHDGKWIWCQKYLHIPYDHYHAVLRDQKANFATSVIDGHVVSNVLIDDYEPNCAAFRRNRGQAILHKDAADTIRQLKVLGYNGH